MTKCVHAQVRGIEIQAAIAQVTGHKTSPQVTGGGGGVEGEAGVGAGESQVRLGTSLVSIIELEFTPPPLSPPPPPPTPPLPPLVFANTACRCSCEGCLSGAPPSACICSRLDSCNRWR